MENKVIPVGDMDAFIGLLFDLTIILRLVHVTQYYCKKLPISVRVVVLSSAYAANIDVMDWKFSF